MRKAFSTVAGSAAALGLVVATGAPAWAATATQVPAVGTQWDGTTGQSSSIAFRVVG